MLTGAKIKVAKPRDETAKLAYSGQLDLLVSTAGGDHWRMNRAFRERRARSRRAVV